MKVPVEAILWRRCRKAIFDTLMGDSRGQYHITLTTRPEIASFFEGLPRRDETSLGGYSVDVPIASFDGPDSVDAQTMEVHFMGERSKRKDWDITAQRPETAYPLWRPGRGVPATYMDSRRDFVLLVRDRNSQFHARWIADEYFDRLPGSIQAALDLEDVGVREFG